MPNAIGDIKHNHNSDLDQSFAKIYHDYGWPDHPILEMDECRERLSAAKAAWLDQYEKSKSDK